MLTDDQKQLKMAMKIHYEPSPLILQERILTTNKIGGPDKE